jgi:predicted ATPase
VPVIRSLAAALARQQALVVLDNCEHLLDPVADLCGALLAEADDARLLAPRRSRWGWPLRPGPAAEYLPG